MEKKSFQMSAWNNGLYRTTGSGYGLKFLHVDKNEFQEKKNDKIILFLGNSNKKIVISANKKSLHNSNLILHGEIGKWLIKNKKSNWKKKLPPKFYATRLNHNQFRITG